MNVKDRIYSRRKELGLTLAEVGTIVGVGKSTVRKWETGDIENMRTDKIALLANALQVSPAYLMGWSDDPSGIMNLTTIDVSTDLITSILGVSKQQLNTMTKEGIRQALESELAGIKNISGIDPESGEYVKQLPTEAIGELNNYIKLLAQAYLKDKKE